MSERLAMKARGETTDYYRVLGVEPDASQEDIKSAYRAMVRETHPDRNGGEEQFKRIKEAYEALSDPRRRAVYDLRKGYKKPAEQGPVTMQNLEDFFDRLMDILRMDWWDEWVDPET